MLEFGIVLVSSMKRGQQIIRDVLDWRTWNLKMLQQGRIWYVMMATNAEVSLPIFFTSRSSACSFAWGQLRLCAGEPMKCSYLGFLSRFPLQFPLPCSWVLAFWVLNLVLGAETSIIEFDIEPMSWLVVSPSVYCDVVMENTMFCCGSSPPFLNSTQPAQHAAQYELKTAGGTPRACWSCEPWDFPMPWQFYKRSSLVN